jgi:8-oxo-dGTP pyrophosphatase MutT (NUDIX family)
MEVRHQVRVGAICRRGDEVLLHRFVPETWWAAPGGRMDPGEFAAGTMARELKEEMGLDLQVGALCAVIEVHFTQKDVRYEEIGLYFNVDPGDVPTETFEGSEGDEVLEFKWFRVAELGDPDIRPKCLVEVLAADDDIVRHLIERD